MAETEHTSEGVRYGLLATTLTMLIQTDTNVSFFTDVYLL